MDQQKISSLCFVIAARSRTIIFKVIDFGFCRLRTTAIHIDVINKQCSPRDRAMVGNWMATKLVHRTGKYPVVLF